MSNEQQFILIVGKDAVLLDTRQQLLRKAGYAVFSTSESSTVKKWLLGGDVAVLVICHTLKAAEVQEIVSFCSEAHSSAGILCLTAGDGRPSLDCSRTYDARKGPAAFIAAVGRMSEAGNVHAATN